MLGTWTCRNVASSRAPSVLISAKGLCRSVPTCTAGCLLFSSHLRYESNSLFPQWKAPLKAPSTVPGVLRKRCMIVGAPRRRVLIQA